jgi:quinol monooxygenase YgiN
MITKKVVFIAKDDSIQELKALLAMMVKPSQAEAGCQLYEIFQMDEKPTTFVVIETWESEDFLEGHRHTPHYAEYKANFEQYCADKYSDPLTSLV